MFHYGIINKLCQRADEGSEEKAVCQAACDSVETTEIYASKGRAVRDSGVGI